MKTEKLQFKTNVQLKSILGKNLIYDDTIAILELVKNSYDANSKNVIVSFKNIKDNDDSRLTEEKRSYTENTSRIVIQDFGKGMNRDDIKDKWLNIAYSEKKEKKMEANRIFAGEKGVGRLSCDRLGEYLNIYTRKTAGPIYHLEIDWKDFEIENDINYTIQQVDINFSEIPEKDFKKNTSFDIFNHGTILEIIKLRSEWTKLEKDQWSTNKLKKLRSQLEKLINPNQAYISKKKQNLFQIEVRAKEFLIEDKEQENKPHDKINGIIENTIFEKLDFKVTTIMAIYDSVKKILTTTLNDKGKTIFEVEEKAEQFDHLSDTGITLYYLNPYAKAYFTKQMGMRSVDFGSIFLFINGFRISPFGDDGDDWLKIDRRKSQGQQRHLGTREVLGRVEVSDTLNYFKIVSSREGVEENESYQQLVNGKTGLFYKVFKQLERYVVRGVDWHSIPEEQSKNLEARVLQNKFKEKDEVYIKSDEEKFRRVYDLIHSIIGIKPKDVIKLHVNEELILNKAKEEKEKAEQEFEKILSGFSKKETSVESLLRVIEEKAKSNLALKKQVDKFKKYSTDPKTTKAIYELENLRQRHDEQEKILNELLEKNKNLEKEKGEADAKASSEEQARKDAENKAETYRSQNLFLKSLQTRNFEQIISLVHEVGTYSDIINRYIVRILKEINKNPDQKISVFIEYIRKISDSNSKITAYSKFATKAGHASETSTVTEDLHAFFVTYINQAREMFSNNGLQISIENINQKEFIRTFSPIEMIMIIDNLVSNAGKAKARNIKFILQNENDKYLEIIAEDDGLGLNKKFKSNPDQIFEFGVTTTDGSGIGLYNVKQILENNRGEIIVDGNCKSGIAFTIRIKK